MIGWNSNVRGNLYYLGWQLESAVFYGVVSGGWPMALLGVEMFFR